MQKNLYLIGDLPGFTPQIGRLVSMLNYTRSTTLQAVAGLAVSELDYLHDPESNSIGTLLSHIAAAETGYQAATFERRELTSEDRQRWAPRSISATGPGRRFEDASWIITWAHCSRCARGRSQSSAGATTDGSKRRRPSAAGRGSTTTSSGFMSWGMKSTTGGRFGGFAAAR